MILPILILFTLCAQVEAQRDSSLTKDFGKLSAKQRTRIAQQEQQDALGDAEFQRLMQEAEAHFQRREYDEALAVYQQARKRRPYNVHPKVKIQDLEAFIKERDRKAAAQKPPVERTSPHSKAPPADPAPVQIASANIDPVGKKRIEVKGSPDPPVKVEKRSVEKPIAKVVMPPPIGERIYKEAGAVVIERVIEEEGRPVIYKKVIHRSGDVVHFRNGLVITQRAWLETFGY